MTTLRVHAPAAAAAAAKPDRFVLHAIDLLALARNEAKEAAAAAAAKAKQSRDKSAAVAVDEAAAEKEDEPMHAADASWGRKPSLPAAAVALAWTSPLAHSLLQPLRPSPPGAAGSSGLGKLVPRPVSLVALHALAREVFEWDADDGDEDEADAPLLVLLQEGVTLRGQHSWGGAVDTEEAYALLRDGDVLEIVRYPKQKAQTAKASHARAAIAAASSPTATATATSASNGKRKRGSPVSNGSSSVASADALSAAAANAAPHTATSPAAAAAAATAAAAPAVPAVAAAASSVSPASPAPASAAPARPILPPVAASPVSVAGDDTDAAAMAIDSSPGMPPLEDALGQQVSFKPSPTPAVKEQSTAPVPATTLAVHEPVYAAAVPVPAASVVNGVVWAQHGAVVPAMEGMAFVGPPAHHQVQPSMAEFLLHQQYAVQQQQQQFIQQQQLQVQQAFAAEQIRQAQAMQVAMAATAAAAAASARTAMSSSAPLHQTHPAPQPAVQPAPQQQQQQPQQPAAVSPQPASSSSSSVATAARSSNAATPPAGNAAAVTAAPASDATANAAAVPAAASPATGNGGGAAASSSRYLLHIRRFTAEGVPVSGEDPVSIRLKGSRAMGRYMKAYCQYKEEDPATLTFLRPAEPDHLRVYGEARLKQDASVYTVPLRQEDTPASLGWDRDDEPKYALVRSNQVVQNGHATGGR